MRARAGSSTMARMLSPNTHIEEVPVLVVGGGPAGLAAAVELARHEIPALLVERRVVLSSHPRATVLSLRSMELMLAHLREQPSARVSLGTELTRVWVDADGVRATLRDVCTGSVRAVRARYLV